MGTILDLILVYAASLAWKLYQTPYLQQPLKGLVRQSSESHRESLQLACPWVDPLIAV